MALPVSPVQTAPVRVLLPHVLVTPRGDMHGLVDTALAKLGKRRRIVIGLPHFFRLGGVISRTDFVLTAPGRLIDNLKMFIPLHDFPSPVKVPLLELFQVWHARTHHDALHKWIRAKASSVSTRNEVDGKRESEA